MEPIEMAALAVGVSAVAGVLIKFLERITDEEAYDYERQPH